MLPLCLDRFGGHRLGIWVSNEREDLAFWLQQPIYDLTTDRPDLALAVRSESHKGGAEASTAA
jgi:glycerophosphoryl diester phosphodiesterase